MPAVGVHIGVGRRRRVSTGGGSTPALHFLGDSMLDGGLLAAQISSNLTLSHATTQDGVGGSTLVQQAGRWAATPQYWGSALISVDAMGPGDGTVATVDDIVSHLQSGKFVFVEGPIHQDLIVGSPARTTTDAQLDGIRAKYASAYVDAFDVVRHYNARTPEDLADVANGIWPRTLRADGVHPNVAGRKLFGQLIAAKIIADGWDGARSAVNARAPVIVRDGADLVAFDGIWFQFPETPPTYQWYKNGSVVSVQSTPAYTLAGTEADDEFHCVVVRGGTSAPSNHLIVNPTPESGYSAETNALINAMDFRPDGAGKAAIAAAMTRVQALAAKLDWFSAPLHNEQASRINWLNPAKIASPVGYPTFAPGRGWTFSSAAGSILNTNWVPASAGGHWTLNDAHIGVDIVTADPSVAAGVVAAASALVLWRPRQYTSTSLVRLNGGTSASLPSGAGVGHQVITGAAGALRAVKSGTQLGSVAWSPTAMSTAPVRIGGDDAFQGLLGGFHFGAALSDGECAELSSILADLRAAFAP